MYREDPPRARFGLPAQEGLPFLLQAGSPSCRKLPFLLPFLQEAGREDPLRAGWGRGLNMCRTIATRGSATALLLLWQPQRRCNIGAMALLIRAATAPQQQGNSATTPPLGGRLSFREVTCPRGSESASFEAEISSIHMSAYNGEMYFQR
jgi:hypothetical protein